MSPFYFSSYRHNVIVDMDIVGIVIISKPGLVFVLSNTSCMLGSIKGRQI